MQIVYTSPCTRAQVERRAARQFVALLDGRPLGEPYSFAYQAQAVVEAALASAGGEVVGRLPDGTPIEGLRDDTRCGNNEPMVVRAEPGDAYLSMDAEGYVGLTVGAASISDAATLADVLRLRDFLNSGAVEALIAAANSFLGAELATPGPAVRVEPCVSDDEVDAARRDTVIGHDFTAGDDDTRVLGYAPCERSATSYPGIILNVTGSDVIPLDRARDLARNLCAVLSDPRFVQAASSGERLALAAD